MCSPRVPLRYFAGQLPSNGGQFGSIASAVRVVHRGVDRADLARVHVEPLGEQVAPHVDARVALEERETEHDAGLLVDDGIAARRDGVDVPHRAFGRAVRFAARRDRALRGERAVLDAHAARVRHHDLAVVRREAVEVAVRDRDELAARVALALRHDALRGSVREQVLGIVERGVRLAAAERAQARVAFAIDDPFGFRDLAVFDLETQRDDRGACGFLERAEVAGLLGGGVEVAALELAERGRGLPEAGAGVADDGVFGLAEGDAEWGRGGGVFDEGCEVLVERGFEARAVAGGGEGVCGGEREARARSSGLIMVRAVEWWSSQYRTIAALRTGRSLASRRARTTAPRTAPRDERAPRCRRCRDAAAAMPRRRRRDAATPPPHTQGWCQRSSSYRTFYR